MYQLSENNFADVDACVAVSLNAVGYQFEIIKSMSPQVQHGIVYNQIQEFVTKYVISKYR